MPNVLPTKSNLIAAKRSRELASTGFGLMDKKRNILIRELMGLIEQAEDLQNQIDTVFSSAYAALEAANRSLGQCDQFAEAADLDDGLTLRYRSVMGVEIPTVVEDEQALALPYGFLGTSAVLDEALLQFTRAKALIRQLAETENTIYRLAHSIRKTQKRANALKNVVIPDFDDTIRQITESLEEKDREEFVRQKVIKAKSDK